MRKRERIREGEREKERKMGEESEVRKSKSGWWLEIVR